MLCVLSHFSHVWLFVTLWTIAHQAPLSTGFSRQEYWSGLPFPSPRDLPNPGIEPASLASLPLAGRFFATSAIWETHKSTIDNCYLKRILLIFWSKFFKIDFFNSLDSLDCFFISLIFFWLFEFRSKSTVTSREVTFWREENSLQRTNKETNFSGILDYEFEKEQWKYWRN